MLHYDLNLSSTNFFLEFWHHPQNKWNNSSTENVFKIETDDLDHCKQGFFVKDLWVNVIKFTFSCVFC